jgi:hypothetical protein
VEEGALGMEKSEVLPFTITFENRNGYLYVLVDGECDSVENSVSYARKIVAECKARGFPMVLVEENFKTQLSIADLFQVASEFSAVGGSLKVAFVDRQKEHYKDNLFGLLVANNRGLNAKMFQDLDEAEEWLLS